jgi:hypothetical protein
VGTAVPDREISVATSLLDVGPPLAPPAAELPAARRRPLAVLVLGAGGMLQAVALVAIALTSLTGMLAAEHRAPDAVIVAVLVALAGWTVLSAAAGAAVLDGGGRQVLVVLGLAELVVVTGLLIGALTTPLLDGALGDLPGPALALLALAVPLGRLLLAGAPSTVTWVAAGPPVREPRADPVGTHRRLCGVTLAVIGLALGGVALLGPSAPAGGPPAPAAATAQ